MFQCLRIRAYRRLVVGVVSAVVVVVVVDATGDQNFYYGDPLLAPWHLHPRFRYILGLKSGRVFSSRRVGLLTSWTTFEILKKKKQDSNAFQILVYSTHKGEPVPRIFSGTTR